MRRCPWCAEEIRDAAVLCRWCGREAGAPAGADGAPPRLRRALRAAELVMGTGAVLLVAWLLAGRLGWVPAGGGPEWVEAIAAVPPRPPHVVPLFPLREVEIFPGEHFDTLFTVEDPRPCLLTGSVTGTAGGRHDVEVLVLDQDGYDRWHNGYDPAALYESGRTSRDSLRVPLPRPGEYALVVSNQFSVFTGKRVLLEGVEVRCE